MNLQSFIVINEQTALKAEIKHMEHRTLSDYINAIDRNVLLLR